MWKMVHITPTKAARAFCVECLGMKKFSYEQIGGCEGDMALSGACPLYPARLLRRISVKYIRKHCLYCMGGNPVAVAECPTTTCSLYVYRSGKNPKRKGIIHKGSFVAKKKPDQKVG
jgi:hypothetical protein